MRVSHPIDQLIHDLEHERAKDYWGRVKRFKAQEAERRKAGKAHEKKQLEYMRAVGIKPGTIEKEQEEDSRELKSYLKQTRPPLVSRRSRSAEDAKHTTRWTAKLGGLGGLIPPISVFQLPPDPSEVLPTNPSKIKIKDVSQGSGTGWWATAHVPVPPVDVVFGFTPGQSARYSFTAAFAFHGFLILKADDGTFTHKDAGVTLDFSLNAFQIVDRGWKSFPRPIDREGDNINEFDNFDKQLLNFSDSQDFREGEPVVVTARIEISASASGSGSHAEINFADGDANFIQPLYLWVSPPP
ncbi:MAG: hypothetical protein WB036_01250 [Pseudolabrys sp.]